MAKTAQQGVRAAMYLRISVDLTGEEIKVDQQQAACEQLAAREGWTITNVYTDNSISAWSGKRRPSWEQLLADVRAGNVDVVTAWAEDRLIRSARGGLDLMEALKDAGAKLHTCKDGVKDPSKASGRFLMQILASAAEFESSRKSERIREANAYQASTLEARKAGPVGYGYKRTAEGKLEIVAHEAAVIRSATKRILAGDSVNIVYRSMNAKGLRTQSGTEWSATTLKGVLLAPRIAGLRVHRGEILGRGKWPPILTEGVWNQVKNKLSATNEAWHTNHKYNRPGTHLLSGLLFCGGCDARMNHSRGNVRGGFYRCSRDLEQHADGAASIDDEVVEAFVFRQASVRVPPPAETVVDPNTVDRQLTEEYLRIDRQLTKLVQDRYRPEDDPQHIDVRSAVRAQGPLEVRLREIEGLMQSSASPAAVDEIEDSPRANLERLIGRILVRPVRTIPEARGTLVPLPARVVIEWRDGVTESGPAPEEPQPRRSSKRGCTLADCPNAGVTSGPAPWDWICGTHYQRWKRLGDVKPDMPIEVHRPKPRCSVPACPYRGSYAGPTPYERICSGHKQRYERNGSVLAEIPLKHGQELPIIKRRKTNRRKRNHAN
jgi:site-specific DNA recombinase